MPVQKEMSKFEEYDDEKGNLKVESSEYPLNLSCTTTSQDLKAYNDRLTELAPTLFCEDDSETEISVIDVPASSPPSLAKFLTAFDFEHHISIKQREPLTRVISLSSQSSINPLSITEGCMRRFLGKYSIGTEFLDMLFAMGNKPRESETGLRKISIKEKPAGVYGIHHSFEDNKNPINEVQDTTYLLVYVEECKDGESTSWPIRHTAVFQRFEAATKTSLWILMNPMENSRAQERMSEAVLRYGQKNSVKLDWTQLHLVILSSYLNNWRWYLNYLSDEISTTVEVALMLRFTNPQDFKAGFKALNNLQHLQDKISPLAARIQATLGTVLGLGNFNTLFLKSAYHDKVRFRSISNELGQFKQELEGHIISIESLKTRSQGILTFLSVTLNLKNQLKSTHINDNMLSLADHNIDDSATIKTVTIVTLVFLPANFVATLFGMNLFAFQNPASTDSGFQVSGQFWLYIVFAAPLSMLAYGSWYLFVERPRQAKSRVQRLRKKERRQDIEEV